MIDFQHQSQVLRRSVLCLLCVVMLWAAHTAAGEEETGTQDPEPFVHEQGTPYRTPRAGEGFRTELFGREVTIDPRDRRFTTAWDLDLIFYEPPPENADLMPIGVVTVWRHPDTNRLFRAEISGFYNDLFWSRKMSGSKYFEWVLAFDNYTVPLAQAELIDGKSVDSQELVWGYVRSGFGLGYRRQVAPGHQDNMAAVDFMIEPGYLYFHSGSNTATNFVVPSDTFVLREHVQTRLDALERNLLELPHRGIAAGADIVIGQREQWHEWGINGSEGNAGRNYESYTAYVLAAGGVPGIESDRHRLIGEVHAGSGRNQDRFSATRVGGGPNPMGEEYGSTVYPVLPGSALNEFFPQHYLLATVQYRWEPVFFAYLGIDATVGRLDRQRLSGNEIVEETDAFRALGASVTSGFLYRTRVNLAYHYNFAVVREGSYGGSEFLVNVSRVF